MSLTRAEAAHALGMKTLEVVDVTDIDGGTVVTTHDGVQTVVAADGGLYAYAGQPDASDLPVWPGGAAEPVEVAEQDLHPDGFAPGELEPPDGTAEEVLAWVGDDPGRAQAALDAEAARPHPRKGLAGELEKRAGVGR